MKPLYLNLNKTDFEEKIDKAWQLLSPCCVCPRKCKVKRTLPKPKPAGFCQMGVKTVVSSFHPHFGEEACLVGRFGSGTIFFTSCNLACVYCQNYEISQLRIGEEIEIEDLAKMMIFLQNQGCGNINLVSPTIWTPQILKAVFLAREKGLCLPLVWNTGGYDESETLKLLAGVVDIYMPDIKYSDNKIGFKYSLAPNYWEVVKKAVKEMHKQVGDLVIDKNGMARRGLLIRHLVLPNNLAGTEKVMKFIAVLSKNSFVNLMDQYYPTNKACLYPEINRRITPLEYQQAVSLAQKYDLQRFDKSF